MTTVLPVASRPSPVPVQGVQGNKSRISYARERALVVEMLHYSSQEKVQDSKNQLMHFAFSVLDSTEVTINSDSGGDDRIQCLYIIKNIKRYVNNTALQPSQQELFQNALQELQFAYEIGCDIAAPYFFDDESDKKRCRADTVAMIQKRIASLLVVSHNGQRVILPGGYVRKDSEGNITGHSVIYEISRQQNGKLRFTIINTGAGAYVDGASNGKRLYVRDIVYSDLELADLNANFLGDLILKMTYPSHTQSMDEVNVCIHKALQKLSGNVTLGRLHCAQRYGSCTLKATTSWLHHRLGRGNYFKYKEQMTRYEIERFDTLSSTLDANVVKAVRSEAEKMLQKRAKKAKAMLPATAGKAATALRSCL